MVHWDRSLIRVVPIYVSAHIVKLVCPGFACYLFFPPLFPSHPVSPKDLLSHLVSPIGLNFVSILASFR